MLPRPPRISLHGPFLSTNLNPPLHDSPTHPSPNRSPHPARQWSFDAKVRMTSLTSEPSTGSPGVLDEESTNIAARDDYTSIWPTYNKAADSFDEKALTKWNADMDVLLIFAALFSAIVTTFLTTALGDLSQDYTQISSLLLLQIATNQPVAGADPTAPFQPPVTAIIVNSLWASSLVFSLAASFGAILCKEWFTEYSDGIDPVVQVFRACRRHMRFMAFDRWCVRTFVTLLPTLLHFSVLLFFAGMLVYVWPLCQTVAIVLCVLVGIMTTAYFGLVLLPLFTLAPFRTSATVVVHHVLHPIVQSFVLLWNGCRFVLFAIPRFFMFGIVTPTCEFLLAMQTLSRQASATLLRLQSSSLNTNFKRHRLHWDVRSEKIDTSSETQDQALLWLVQIPMDPQDAGGVVHTLESITFPRFHTFACSSVILFLTVTLESAFENGVMIPERFSVAMDCVLVLSRIKFHLVVECNQDDDDTIGRVSVSSFLAWAAQALLKSPNLKPATVLELSAAAAWLSPAEKVKDERFGEIRERGEYLQVLQLYIQGHTDHTRPIEPSILVNTLRGLHAFIPRGNYGHSSSIWAFLPMFSEDLDGPWFYDEEVLQALAFYALDLISPISRRWAKQDRDVSLGYLVTKLMGYLKVPDSTKPLDAVDFVFSLVYKWPTLLQNEKASWPLSDIARICDDARIDNILPRATMAYSALLHNTLKLGNHSRNLTRDIQGSSSFILRCIRNPESCFYAIYSLSMTLKVVAPVLAQEILKELDPSILVDSLLRLDDDIRPTDDLEKGVVALETMLYLKIHTILVLTAYPQIPTVDDTRLGKLMECVAEVAVNNPDPRFRCQAIYLAVLLNTLFLRDHLTERVVWLGEHLRDGLNTGQLVVVSDWANCGLPSTQAGIASIIERVPSNQVLEDGAFEWVGDFPLIPLGGTAVQ